MTHAHRQLKLQYSCSTAGMRSGKYAAKLKQQDGIEAKNLRGSIIAWVSPFVKQLQRHVYQ